MYWYPLADCTMNHGKMLQDSAWPTIVSSITKAILGNIQGFVSSRTPINSLQNTIHTPGIDFTEIVIQARVIANSAWAHEASSKEFCRKSRVETHHFTRIIVYTIEVSCCGCVGNRRKQRIQRKHETASLGSLQ